jgi:hypothetical protein
MIEMDIILQCDYLDKTRTQAEKGTLETICLHGHMPSLELDTLKVTLFCTDVYAEHCFSNGNYENEAR